MKLPLKEDLDYIETHIQRHTGGIEQWWEQAKILPFRDIANIIITIWEAGRKD